MGGRRWTRAEEALLRHAMNGTSGRGRPRRGRRGTLRALAEVLDRSYGAVRHRAQVLRARWRAGTGSEQRALLGGSSER